MRDADRLELAPPSSRRRRRGSTGRPTARRASPTASRTGRARGTAARARACPRLDRAGDARERREQRDRLEPGRPVGRRRDEQVVDQHRAVEAEVLGAPQVGAHLGERRRLVAEREARQPQPERASGTPTSVAALVAGPPGPGPLTTSGARAGGRRVAAPADDRLAVDEDHADARAGRRSRGHRARCPRRSPRRVDERDVRLAADGDRARLEPVDARGVARSPGRRRSPARCRRARRGGPSSAGSRAARRRSPTARRCRGSPGRGRRSRAPGPIACSAARPLPQWTISIAIPLATSCSMSASGSAVVPPLTWPTMSGRASSTTSARIALEPAIDGPPVWNVDTMPCVPRPGEHRRRLRRRSSRSPGRPRRRALTPAAASSAKSCLLEAQLEDRGAGVDLHARPGGRWRTPARATIASALSPTMSFGRPGRWTSPAEIIEVTPAVELGLDEVDRALARRPVAEHRVDVGVDEAGERRGALARR